LFYFFGNSENKQQRLEACVIMHKYAKHEKYANCAKYVNKYAIKYAEKYAIKYVKYATTCMDMQKM
jgi:hypothetical protein